MPNDPNPMFKTRQGNACWEENIAKEKRLARESNEKLGTPFGTFLDADCMNLRMNAFNTHLTQTKKCAYDLAYKRPLGYDQKYKRDDRTYVGHMKIFEERQKCNTKVHQVSNDIHGKRLPSYDNLPEFTRYSATQKSFFRKNGTQLQGPQEKVKSAQTCYYEKPKVIFVNNKKIFTAIFVKPLIYIIFQKSMYF